MRLLVFPVILFLISCGTKKTDFASNQINDEETFDDFFNKFRSDSIFQIERVKFPLALVTWNIGDNLMTDNIDRDDWRHLRLEYKNEFATREIDAYTQETKIYTDSATIQLRGVDNGIHLDYVFNKINGKWILIIERDYSN
jgi:hypothetical protein